MTVPVASALVPATADLRRTRARRRLGAAVALVALVAMAGCSAPAPKQQDIADALVDSGISRKVADCTAKALTDSLSSSELAEIAERGGGGVPVDDPNKTGEGIDRLNEAMVRCRELQVASEPTTTTTTTTAPVPSTTAVGGGDASTTVAPATDGAELNPASSTTIP